MKKALLPACLILSAYCILSSCARHKEVARPAPDFSATPAMDGAVSGSAWTASVLSAAITEDNTIRRLEISGLQQSTKETVSIAIMQYNDATRTYYMGTNEASTAFYKRGDLDGDYARSGKVVIYSAAMDTVKGTYDFVTVNGTEVAGKFTVAPVK